MDCHKILKMLKVLASLYRDQHTTSENANNKTVSTSQGMCALFNSKCENTATSTLNKNRTDSTNVHGVKGQVNIDNRCITSCSG